MESVSEENNSAVALKDGLIMTVMSQIMTHSQAVTLAKKLKQEYPENEYQVVTGFTAKNIH